MPVAEMTLEIFRLKGYDADVSKNTYKQNIQTAENVAERKKDLVFSRIKNPCAKHVDMIMGVIAINLLSFFIDFH
jgi:hypothetical protein